LRKIFNFFPFFFDLYVLDPDPESASLMQIRIQGVIFNADPDPKHWYYQSLTGENARETEKNSALQGIFRRKTLDRDPESGSEKRVKRIRNTAFIFAI